MAFDDVQLLVFPDMMAGLDSVLLETRRSIWVECPVAQRNVFLLTILIISILNNGSTSLPLPHQENILGSATVILRCFILPSKQRAEVAE